MNLTPPPWARTSSGLTLPPWQRKAPERGEFLSGGTLSDIFDVLQVGQFATAGALAGKGIRRGIRERTSFGELFSEEFRSTRTGKVAEFALNVLGDPITYIPIGGLAVKGVRVLPGGARAIRAAKVPFKAVATRAGLAFPEQIRAARVIEDIGVGAEVKLEPLREILRGARSEQHLARIQAAAFGREFRKDIATVAGRNRELAKRLRQLPSEYFDLPARQFVNTIRGEATQKIQGILSRIPGKPEELSPQFFEAAKKSSLQTRERWLSSLNPTERAFVEKWAQPIADAHNADLSRLVQLGLLTPQRAELWRGIYLRNAFLKNIDPERYFAILAETDPVKAAELMGKFERTERFVRPGAKTIRTRKALTAEQQEVAGFIKDLDARYALQRSLNAELIARAELSDQVGRLYAIPDDLIESGLLPAKMFRRMEGRKWGGLAGRWVPKEVHDILEGQFWKPEGGLAVFTKLISAWKIGKVSMPGTIRRNITTNFSAIHARFGARGLVETLAEIPAARRDLATVSGMFQRAVKAHPGFASSHLDAEVGEVLRRLGDTGGVADAIVKATQAIGRPFTTAYEYSELVPKLALFRSGVKAGLSDQAAAIRAITTLFDYGEVPPAILAMRRWGLYPFVTFPYKVATELVPRVAEHPGRLANQIKAVRAITVPETEEEKRALPEQMRTGGYIKLPWTDWKGRPLYYDLTYELFFGDIGEAGTPTGHIIAALRGDETTGRAIATLLTPIGQAVAEIASNRSFFTGGPIVREEEPQTLGRVRHIARLALPGPVFAAAETAGAPLLRRAGLLPSSGLARATQRIPSFAGVEPPSIGAAAAQTFGGIRTVPLDVPRSLVAQSGRFDARLRELQARINSVASSRSLSEEEKRDRIERLQAIYRRVIREFQESGSVRQR